MGECLFCHAGFLGSKSASPDVNRRSDSFSRVLKGYNVQRLQLQEALTKLKVIHVAGTKGKVGRKAYQLIEDYLQSEEL